MNRLGKLLKVRASLMTAELMCGNNFPGEAKQTLLVIEGFVRQNTDAKMYQDILMQDRSRCNSTRGMIKSGKVAINQKHDLSEKISLAQELLNGKEASRPAVA